MNEQEKIELHKEIKADILAKEEEDKRNNKWLDYLSISTILIALCTTLSTYMGSNYSGQEMMSQMQASDQWAYYQSKGIKQYIYETQLDNFRTELQLTQPGAAQDSIKKKIDTYTRTITKYGTEKDKVSKGAKQMETLRDASANHSNAFGLAVVFLEISILLSSIAGLIKKKLIWYISMIPGIIGIVYFINGFILFL